MCIIRKYSPNNGDEIRVNPEELNQNNPETEDIDQVEEPVDVNANQIELDRQLAEEFQNRELERQQRNRNRRFREQQQKRTPLKPEPAFRGLGCRGKSYKKYRRYENANLFNSKDSSVIDGDDHLNELSIYDFVPHSVSALASLLMDQENMQAWNNFINLSEEAQDQVLDEYDRQNRRRDSSKFQGKQSSQTTQIVSIHVYVEGQ